MAKYTKILAWIAPVVVPIAVTGIRSLLKKRKDNLEDRDEEQTNGDVLDQLVDAGLSSLTRGRGRWNSK